MKKALLIGLCGLLLMLLAMPSNKGGQDNSTGPSPYISREAAMTVALGYKKTAKWTAYLDERAEFRIDGKKVIAPAWVMRATSPPNSGLVITVDALTGQLAQISIS